MTADSSRPHVTQVIPTPLEQLEPSVQVNSLAPKHSNTVQCSPVKIYCTGNQSTVLTHVLLSLPPTGWWRTACMMEHHIEITPGFFCCHQVYSVVKRDLSQWVAHLLGLHTGSFCQKTETRRAQEVEAKTRGSSPSMLRGQLSKIPVMY